MHVNTPINNASGIYLEKVGTLGKSTASWKFVIHFDFTDLEDEEQLLLQRYSILTSFCNELVTLAPWEPCKVTIKVLNSTLNEVMDNNFSLRQLFRTPSKVRRGIVNGIGRLSKFLFGTMDDEDALQLEKSLKILKTTQNKLHHILDSRTSVLINTIETLSKSQTVLNNQFQTLQQKLATIALEVQNKTLFTKTLHFFDEVANLMTISMGRLLSKQEEITDILHEARLGKLDKHLANSPLFINAYKEIQLELPQDLQLPVKPTAENLQLLDTIAQAELLYAINNLTLHVSIPLVSDFYQLHRLTSIPAKHTDELYYFVKTNSEYLAINEKLKQYIFLKQKDFDKCIAIENDSIICKTNFLLYNQNSQNCIIRIILNHQDLSQCEIRAFKPINEMWYPLSKPNSWLYVLPHSINVRIYCNDIAYSIKVSESGILELYPGCKASTNQVNLETIDEMKFTKPTLYHFNSTFLDEGLNFNLTKENVQNVQVSDDTNLENIDLEKISVSPNELKKQTLEYQDYESPEPIPTYSFYIILGILIVLLLLNAIYFVMKKVIKCKISINPPTQVQNTENL